MEEVIKYKQTDSKLRKRLLHATWKRRLVGCQANIEVWQRLLAVRSLVLPPEKDIDSWLKFANLCLKSSRQALTKRILCYLLQQDPFIEPIQPLPLTPHPVVAYSSIKYLWATRKDPFSTEENESCLNSLQSFISSLEQTPDGYIQGIEVLSCTLPVSAVLAKSYLCKGQWLLRIHHSKSSLPSENPGLLLTHYERQVLPVILSSFQAATEFSARSASIVHSINASSLSSTSSCASGNFFDQHEAQRRVLKTQYKAWHSWALANFEALSMYSRNDGHFPPKYQKQRIRAHLAPAIVGFFRSIALATPDKSLQDTLRLLTLWFKYGAQNEYQREVDSLMREGFSLSEKSDPNSTPSRGGDLQFPRMETHEWLIVVIPQLIARIHAQAPSVARLVHDLLASIGRQHPQALVYPLTVASQSQSTSRQQAAASILDTLRRTSNNLVEQAMLVSHELIRIAILWHEMWHEGLEEASRMYFGERNVEGMLSTLLPLHSMVEGGPHTHKEASFTQAFGRELHQAMEYCKRYQRTGKETDMNQAWDIYYLVFRRLHKQLPQITQIELQYVSPRLLHAHDLDLAVPGTYKSNEPEIRIGSFSPTLAIITSKQRPRKLTIVSRDERREYVFLLKGHEDLRQDERVMQLFGLVNTLLIEDRETAKKHLAIQRFAVVPLSPNSGLIGWVPHCDTFHALIREYRESRKIQLNIEHRLMMQMSADYDKLSLIQKIEIFQYALDSTSGHDLSKVLWLKSPSSEVWLDRRTNYTRSLAVMSMVGYILGLGDRHPSNLMLHRYNGNIIHIDFGDCFEVAMQREKYPEKIPFRLTRMLVKAMEISGIEGNFRFTCESVMRVLRQNKDSLMAVLEAFVYDPLINWRLLNTLSPPDFSDVPAPGIPAHPTHTRSHSHDLDAEQVTDVLNERAVLVIDRVSNKLTGRDFSKDALLDVPSQVQRLIDQATSHENLCQCYIGWCPFW
eukprot:TRINITY_DN17389_c0_g1_i1.p1 TRINITY_DN17389_c0_g1~~TRINITY_DN17389_c0_g1_i1.p1  ORF type:complete len:1008 (-),score=152.93 TRINITY_DN17389_c0_g1_i1:138-3029(-)